MYGLHSLNEELPQFIWQRFNPLTAKFPFEQHFFLTDASLTQSVKITIQNIREKYSLKISLHRRLLRFLPHSLTHDINSKRLKSTQVNLNLNVFSLRLNITSNIKEVRLTFWLYSETPTLFTQMYTTLFTHIHRCIGDPLSEI